MAGTAQKSAKARVTYFDWLRGMATLAVVVLHMFNKILTDHPTAELGVPMVLAWTELQLLLTRWAVPIFLMVTGALLLDPKRELGWPKLGRYILRMVETLAIFCPVYACVSAKTISLAAIGKGLTDLVTEGSWDHLWYPYALIELYLLTPILSAYVRGTSQRMQRDTLLVLAIPTLLMTTFRSATHLEFVDIDWVGFPVFYYLLGSYVHQYLHLDRTTLLVGLGALALCAVACAAIICLQVYYPKWLIVPQCPLVALWAVLVFVAVRSAVGHREPPCLLAFASSHSLSIYLLHPIVMVVLYRRLWWMPYETMPPVIFEVVVLAIAFGVTLPAAALLKRIPVLRDIL